MSNEEPTVEELQRELEKKNLKIQALLEDITSTRDTNADLRVEITYLTKYIQDSQRANVPEEPPASAE